MKLTWMHAETYYDLPAQYRKTIDGTPFTLMNGYGEEMKEWRQVIIIPKEQGVNRTGEGQEKTIIQ